MTNPVPPVNPTIAPLRNVMLFTALVEGVMNRTEGLPGLGVFKGRSGDGKTTATIYAANKFRAYHVQMKSVWTRKKICTAILNEMGILPNGKIEEMVEQIAYELTISNRPLFIDEADFLVAKNMIEVVRDIHESGRVTIIMIGEEAFGQKLKRWERVYRRVLIWEDTQPTDMRDARHLAKLYCKGVEIAEDLLSDLVTASGANAGHIVINLDRVMKAAQNTGLEKIGRAEFGTAFFTGSPAPRSGS